jgi:hypothetical protein
MSTHINDTITHDACRYDTAHKRHDYVQHHQTNTEHTVHVDMMPHIIDTIMHGIIEILTWPHISNMIMRGVF